MSAADSRGEQPAVELAVCPGGPLLVRGRVVLEDAEGRRHESDRPVSAVCRCGISRRKPWCDGSHALLPADKRP